MTEFDTLAFLHQDYCMLDFIEAYAPDGKYLAVKLARDLTSFRYGLPAEFFSFPPTQDLVDEICDILLWNNP